jgi:hypothetical protein
VVAGYSWDRLRTAAFLRQQGIHPGSELPPGASADEATVKAWPPPETKRITVVERRPRSGVTPVLPRTSDRRLRWALTGAAAALALSAALALGL